MTEINQIIMDTTNLETILKYLIKRLEKIEDRIEKLYKWAHNVSELSKAREFPDYEPNLIDEENK